MIILIMMNIITVHTPKNQKAFQAPGLSQSSRGAGVRPNSVESPRGMFLAAAPHYRTRTLSKRLPKAKSQKPSPPLRRFLPMLPYNNNNNNSNTQTQYPYPLSKRLPKAKQKLSRQYYIYIYIYIERERDVYIYIYIYIHIYIYIYIYIFPLLGAQRLAPGTLYATLGL